MQSSVTITSTITTVPADYSIFIPPPTFVHIFARPGSSITLFITGYQNQRLLQLTRFPSLHSNLPTFQPSFLSSAQGPEAISFTFQAT